MRTILESLGLAVNRLIRTSYGPFQLLEMEPGTVEPVKARVLKEHLGVRVRRPISASASKTTSRLRPRKPPPKRKGWA